MSCPPTSPPDVHWTTMNATALIDLARWRADHPQATLTEIERAVDCRLSANRAALIAEVAADAPDDCPDCGMALRRIGTQPLRLTTAQGGELEFEEPIWRCPACAAGTPPR